MAHFGPDQALPANLSVPRSAGQTGTATEPTMTGTQSIASSPRPCASTSGRSRPASVIIMPRDIPASGESSNIPSIITSTSNPSVVTVTETSSAAANPNAAIASRYYAVGAGVALSAILLIACTSYLIWRWRASRLRRRRYRSTHTDVNWTNMLKTLNTAISPIAYDVETPRTATPTSYDVDTPRTATSSPQRAKKLPLLPGSPLRQQQRVPASSQLPKLSHGIPLQELDGSVVGKESEAVGEFAVELEGCTPVEQHGRFVWPSPSESQRQSHGLARLNSIKKLRSGIFGDRRSQKEDNTPAPAPPPKMGIPRAATLKR